MDETAQDRLRERIYDAVIEEFKVRGFKFTMDDIAKRLSISKKTIYQVEKDKETLFYDTASHIYSEIKKSEQAVMDDESLTTLEKLRKILIVMPEGYRELDWRQIYQLEDSYPRIFARVSEMVEQQWDNTIELLRRGMEEGVIREVPIPIVKTMFEAALERYMETKVLIDAGMTFDEAAQSTLDILMKGIAACRT